MIKKGNTLLTKEHAGYFNRKALLHMWIVFILFIAVDMAILAFTDEFYYSKSFHFKVVLCFIYLAVSKEKSISILKHESMYAAFHFSVFLLCLWLLFMNIPTIRDDVSRIVGMFLVAGALLGLNISDELRKTIKGNTSRYVGLVSIACVFIKLLAIFMFIFSVIFLFFGDWGMNIEPFYEW